MCLSSNILCSINKCKYFRDSVGICIGICFA